MADSPTQIETQEKIRKSLGPVRWLRWMAMFGLFIPVGLTVLIVIAHKLSGGEMSFMVSGAPWTHLFWHTLFYMFVAGTFFSFLNLARACPRCGNGFFQRRGFRKRGTRSKLKRSGWQFNVNTFSRSCLNCGLRLDGSNAGESF